jgi:hypothetical protein
MEAVSEIYSMGVFGDFGHWNLGLEERGSNETNDWMEGTYLWSIRCTTTSRQDMEAHQAYNCRVACSQNAFSKLELRFASLLLKGIYNSSLIEPPS